MDSLTIFGLSTAAFFLWVLLRYGRLGIDRLIAQSRLKPLSIAHLAAARAAADVDTRSNPRRRSRFEPASSSQEPVFSLKNVLEQRTLEHNWSTALASYSRSPKRLQESEKCEGESRDDDDAQDVESSHHKTVPSTTIVLGHLTRRPAPDIVDVSVFGPTEVKAEAEALIQVFLHRPERRKSVLGLVSRLDPRARHRAIQTLETEIESGQLVDVILEGRGLNVDNSTQSLTWRGGPSACQFLVQAPALATSKTFYPRALVLIDSVPIGSIVFSLKVTAARKFNSKATLRGDRARSYAYAFLSYASADRAEVIKRAQGLKAAGIDFFGDLLSLEPGERWERKLYEKISQCDLFCLFWSSQAKASEWVMKETEYALACQATSADGRPDIVPVILEGPPPPQPPESLKDIHFNDSLLYLLAGIQTEVSQVHPRVDTRAKLSS